MEKLIEIDGRWIQIKSKVIQINGEEVITQGEIKILDLISFDEVKNQINSLNSIAKPVDLAVNKYRQANDLFEQREASF